MIPATSEFNKQKRNILICLAAAAIVLTMVISISDQFVPQSGKIIPYLVAMIVWGLGILAWCRVDAEERNAPLSGAWKGVLVFFGIFGFLFYVFDSRGFTNGLKTLAWALLYWISVVFASFVCSFVVLMVLLIAGVITFPEIQQ